MAGIVPIAARARIVLRTVRFAVIASAIVRIAQRAVPKSVPRVETVRCARIVPCAMTAWTVARARIVSRTARFAATVLAIVLSGQIVRS